MVLDEFVVLSKCACCYFHVMLRSLNMSLRAVEDFMVFADDLEEQTSSQRTAWQTMPSRTGNNLMVSRRWAKIASMTIKRSLVAEE